MCKNLIISNCWLRQNDLIGIQKYYIILNFLSPAYNQSIAIVPMGKKKAIAPTKAPPSTSKKSRPAIAKAF